MRFIPTRFHGLIDYIVGVALIAAPWVFGFVPSNDYATWGNETMTPIVLGILVILQALLTNYEWGAYKYIQMPTHLMVDVLVGVFLAASPWFLGYAEYVYGPHLTVGLAVIVIAMCTKRAPETATPNLMGTQQSRYNTAVTR